MKTRKRILYLIFLAMLWAPLLQMWTHLFPQQKLYGAYTQHTKPELTAKNWFSGDFQYDYTRYLNDTLGFHADMVKFRNYCCYKLFHTANAFCILIGKEDYLYEMGYIQTKNGEEYVGTPKIKEYIHQAKALDEFLSNKGKTLIIVLAPNKADFYPEYIPKRYLRPATDSTNYKQFSKLLKASGLNVIDFNDWFLKKKATASYPLFPKYGIHWSEYGMLMAADSLSSYIEQIQHTPLAHLVFDGNEISTTPSASDFDIGKTLNLPDNTLNPFVLCYPKWHWQQDSNYNRPKAIVIADSFYWQLFNIGFQQHCLDGQFWYYYKTIYPDSYEHELTVEDINVRQAINDNDIVMLIITSIGLKDFGWGIMDELRLGD
ncbi:MAG: hypothetical protein MJZ57_08165 [Bacteroidales bacterium]|nr:hypothetical protein [Bacteroidales bacterium]